MNDYHQLGLLYLLIYLAHGIDCLKVSVMFVNFCIWSEFIRFVDKLCVYLLNYKGILWGFVSCRRYHSEDDNKQAKTVYLEDPFGNLFELYSHTYEGTYASE